VRRGGHWFRSHFEEEGLLATHAGGSGANDRPLWLGVTLWLLVATAWLAGAPRSAAVVLGVLALLLGLAFFRPLSRSFNAFALFFFALSLWTVLTAAPLPCGFVRWLSPFAAGIWTDSLLPLGEAGPTYCALSLAPTATVQSATNLSAYAVLAAAAGSLARKLGLWTVLLSVFGISVLVALLTLVHGVLGAETLLGLSFLPTRSGVRPASVFVNPNNLAGCMNLGTFCGLALLAARQPRVPRALLVVGGMICVATLIQSGSRGGVLSFAFGVLSWSILGLFRRFSSARALRSEWSQQAPFALVLLLAGLLVAVVGASPGLERELFGGDLDKMQQLGHLASSLQRVDWLGIGRGAFDSLSAQLTNEGQNLTSEYAENFALSWLFEWGPLVGGAALVALCLLLSPTRLRLRGQRCAQVAWLGLIVLLLQNFADLGLELPALAGALAVLGGALDGSRARSEGTPASAVAPTRPRPLASLLALVFFCSAATAWSGPALAAMRSYTRDQAERALAPASSPADRGNAWRSLTAGMRRFPAEPYFVLVGGWLALAQGRDGLPWAAQALRRAPGSGRTHVLVAEVLARRGAVDQALLHVRLAVAADETLAPALAARALRLTTDPRGLAAAAPPGAPGVRLLLEMLNALPLRADPRVRRHLLAAAVERAPDDIRVQSAEGWALLGDVQRGEAPCPLETPPGVVCPVRPDAPERILALAARTRGTVTCDGLRLHAALLVEQGHTRGALDVLSSCPSCVVPGHCAKDRVALALDHGDEAERRLALGAFRAAMCDSPSACAEAEAWLASLFERRSQPELSLVHAFRAAEIEPSAARYLAAARAARNAGRVDRVQTALSRARRLGGGDRELEGWLATHGSHLPRDSK
jgi:hypothetical protein